MLVVIKLEFFRMLIFVGSFMRRLQLYYDDDVTTDLCI